MANIKELRQKFPQFSDLDDYAFVDTFQENYYPGTPKEELYQEVGLEVPTRFEALKAGGARELGRLTGGIEQIATGGSPELAERMAGQEERYQLGKRFHPKTAMAGAAAGMIGGMAPIDLAAVATMGPGGMLAGPGARAAGGAALRGAAGAGARGAAGQAAKAPSYMGKVGRGAAEMAPPAALAGGVGAGMQYMPEGEDRTTHALMGAALGGLFGGAVGGAAQGLKPSNIAAAQTRLPPEEMLRRSQAAGSTETNVGQILEAPFYTQMQENILAQLPGTGARGSIQRTRTSMEDQAGDLFGSFGAKGQKQISADVKKDLQSSLQQSAAQKESRAGEMYGVRNEIADELGETSSRIMTAEKARELYSTRLGDAAEREAIADPTILKDLKFYSNPSAGDSTITQLQQTAKNFREKSEAAASKTEMNKASIYGQLEAAARSDIDALVEGAALRPGGERLGAAHKEANAYFKENIVPLRDKKKMLRKYIDDKDLSKSENIVKDFVSFTRGKDAADNIQLLKNNLTPEGKENLNFAVFGDELGNASAKTIKDVWGKLGPAQKDSMLAPGTAARKQMDELFELARMNPKAFHEMFNPETGASLKVVEALKLAGIGAGLSFLPGATATSLAVGMGLNKLMTSPKIRNYIVNAAIKGKQPTKAQEKSIMNDIARALKESPVTAGVIESERSTPRRMPVEVYTEGEYPE